MRRVIVDAEVKKSLWRPAADSHKGQNGRVLVIGGSHFFHAASLWSLTTVSRLVDLVHYASVPENNDIVRTAKAEFRNGMVVERIEIEQYIDEDDAVLIGPGMVRPENNAQNVAFKIESLKDALAIADEGLQTQYLTNYLLKKYPKKKWVIDAGALQTVDISVLPKGAILTPHHKEFAGLVDKVQISAPSLLEQLVEFACTTETVVLLKGQVDYICNGQDDTIYEVHGGNPGMTKGGTGDVLAGLTVGLLAKNPALSAACVASYLNKAAGDRLYARVGPYFNASDLANEIPVTMKEVLYGY